MGVCLFSEFDQMLSAEMNGLQKKLAFQSFTLSSKCMFNYV